MKNVEFEDDFKRQLDLYLKGRLSASQKAEFEKQLDDFKKEDTTPYEFNQQHSDDLWKKISAETINKDSNRPRMWISIAAAIILVGVVAMLSLSRDNNKVILKDGSIVWLKNGASLDYSKLTVDDRQVTLTGEALFEVARMREHPFVIHCGKYEARVLGTSFNIKSYNNSVELTVLTGTVELSSLDTSVLVYADQHLYFDKIATITKSTQQASTTVTENTQYNMLFEDTRMIDVVKRVEDKFDVDVKLENADIGNCMISADFTDQSLPLTLDMISEALGFHYEIKDDEVIITGSGCKE